VLASSALERERQQALDAVGRVLGLDRWPDVPVSWNRRLRRAGRAVTDGHGARLRRARIELSPAYFEVYPEDLFGILVHEAVHVGLAIVGLPNGHGPEFRDACDRAGGLRHGRPMPGRVFRYECPVCRRVVERRRRAADDRWCAACVEASVAQREPPYAPERALVLVGTRFAGPAGRPVPSPDGMP
jgi:predicted SprT family Zn-dependent metalloprotease